MKYSSKIKEVGKQQSGNVQALLRSPGASVLFLGAQLDECLTENHNYTTTTKQVVLSEMTFPDQHRATLTKYMNLSYPSL